MSLYAKYRPAAFSQVIGQDATTNALSNAIANSRISHAYLFSGPRGCGKTSCARILAKCLNCEKGPTPNPCGECQSCMELSKGCSMDVMEIDAASHNSVDDARNLREQALLSPVRDRYKIFILDEAHMITMQGFNALLKVVEEPPDNTIFIFATTAPEKVIPTIRSRTVRYPFRLVGSEKMKRFLEGVCAREGVEIEGEVLDLVVKKGAGSVRDSLSVLEELIYGRSGNKVDSEEAKKILGVAPSELVSNFLDSVLNGEAKRAYELSCEANSFEPISFLEEVLGKVREKMIENFSRGLNPDAAGRLIFASESIKDYLPLFKLPIDPALSLDLLTSKLLSFGSSPIPVPSQASKISGASPKSEKPRAVPVAEEDDNAKKWEEALASMPEGIRVEIGKEKVAKVEFCPQNGAMGICLTFFTRRLQNIFALKIKNDAEIMKKINEAARSEFGANASVYGANVAANGEKVTKIKNMTPAQLSELYEECKSEISQKAECALTPSEIALKVGGTVMQEE